MHLTLSVAVVSAFSPGLRFSLFVTGAVCFVRDARHFLDNKYFAKSDLALSYYTITFSVFQPASHINRQTFYGIVFGQTDRNLSDYLPVFQFIAVSKSVRYKRRDHRGIYDS